MRGPKQSKTLDVLARLAAGYLAMAMEYECGFDRSQLYSDEAPPIRALATEPWVEVTSELASWVLRWN